MSSSTTRTYYYYDNYSGDYNMGDNSTLIFPPKSNTSTVPTGTFNPGSGVSTERRGLGEPEDTFLYYVMIAVIGAISFIVITTATCFVYRSRKRARSNMRRVKTRRRPGTMSLELLERDLLASGLPLSANQPLYGIEDPETTEMSDMSSSVVRQDSHTHSTRSKKTSVDNGATSNVRTITNNTQRESERKKSVKPLADSVQNCQTDQAENGAKQDEQTAKKEALRPPTRKESGKKKIPPKVAEKPTCPSKRKEQITKSNSEKEDTKVEVVAQQRRTTSTTSSEYENPEGVIQLKKNTTMVKRSDNNPTTKSKSRKTLPKPPVKDTTKSGNLKSKCEKELEITNALVLDISISVPPPSPCTTENRYVNAPGTSSDQAFSVNGQKHGYVNVPHLSNSSKEGTKSKNAKQDSKAGPKLRKGSSADPPDMSKNDEYVNLKSAVKKRGHSVPSSANVLENSISGHLDSVYMFMGASQEEDMYLPMDGVRRTEDVYLDMSSGQYETLDSKKDKTYGYVNAHAASGECGVPKSCGGDSHGYINTNGSEGENYSVPRAETGYSVPRADTGYAVPRTETGYSVPPVETGYSVPRAKTSQSVPRAETGYSVPRAGSGGLPPQAETDYSVSQAETGYSVPRAGAGYSVPRAATCQFDSGAHKYVNAGRSRSTDNIYDYAELKAMNGILNK